MDSNSDVWLTRILVQFCMELLSRTTLGLFYLLFFNIRIVILLVYSKLFLQIINLLILYEFPKVIQGLFKFLKITCVCNVLLAEIWINFSLALTVNLSNMYNNALLVQILSLLCGKLLPCCDFFLQLVG